MAGAVGNRLDQPVPADAVEADDGLAFESCLGGIGLVWRERRLVRLTFGHPSVQEAQRGLGQCRWWNAANCPDFVARWCERLQRYAAGGIDDFRDLPIDEASYTPFQRRVVRACRRIPYGATSSYGALAAQAGNAAAARAVGRVMATNRLPLVVPCHRVLGAGGALGGFSAPDGLAMKRRLLALEAAAWGAGLAPA